jgi:membrane associated rhomboid family serine protease
MLPFTRRWTEGRLSVTAVLVGAHAAAYTAEFVAETLGPYHGFDPNSLWSWLALSGPRVAEGDFWQFASFALVHAGPLHALANALLLYFAGRELEPIVGSRHFLGIFVAGNLLGGLLHWLVMPEVPLVGISPGVVAILVAFTTTLPELEVTVNLFFVLPVRLRARYLALSVVAVCTAMIYARTTLQIGPVAMLAACGLGWFYARQLGFGNPLFFQRYLFQRRQRAARLERMTPDQFISSEVDPILEKIAEHGLQSLTRAERRTLEKGSEKITSQGAQTRDPGKV